MIWKRALLFSLLAVAGLAVQTSIFATATLLGTKPPLLLLIVVGIAMSEGQTAGASGGFVLGLATDLLGVPPRGITPLVWTVAGYAVGRLRPPIQEASVRLPVAVVVTATVAAVLMQGLVSALLGGEVSGWATARHAVLAAAYNAVLTPFVFPLVRALARRLRPSGPLPEAVR